MRQRLRLEIDGRVQGVGFRHACCQAARGLGLSGWVRNTADGGVDVVAEGDPAALERLAAWCRHGPPGARVAACRKTTGDAMGVPDGFEVRCREES